MGGLIPINETHAGSCRFLQCSGRRPLFGCLRKRMQTFFGSARHRCHEEQGTRASSALEGFPAMDVRACFVAGAFGKKQSSRIKSVLNGADLAIHFTRDEGFCCCVACLSPTGVAVPWFAQAQWILNPQLGAPRAGRSLQSNRARNARREYHLPKTIQCLGASEFKSVHLCVCVCVCFSPASC